MTDQADASRRRALVVLSAVGATGVIGVGALPTCRLALAPALEGGGGDVWSPVSKLADLPEGKPVRARVIRDEKDGFTNAKAQPVGQVWLLRTKDTVAAFSATCPHLGCTVDLSPDAKQFYCPCHSSSFEFSGERAAGKPNQSLRGLDPVAVRVTPEKVVEVQFKRFKLGTSERTELG